MMLENEDKSYEGVIDMKCELFDVRKMIKGVNDMYKIQ